MAASSIHFSYSIIIFINFHIATLKANNTQEENQTTLKTTLNRFDAFHLTIHSDTNQWSQWSDCTVQCGGGSQNRSHNCSSFDDSDCQEGYRWQISVCNLMPCVEWGHWGEWSGCTVSCGEGSRIRTRSCPIPNACGGNSSFDFETDSNCTTQPCSFWTQWASWTSCSKTCGQGNRRRARKCTPVADVCLGSSTNVEPCYLTPCPLKADWSGWSPCTTSCGGGVKVRSKVTCARGPPFCPTVEETGVCEEDPCPQWSTWLPWIECSKSCAGGTRVRRRSCPILNGCVGRNYEIDKNRCNNFPCVKNLTKAL